MFTHHNPLQFYFVEGRLIQEATIFCRPDKNLFSEIAIMEIQQDLKTRIFLLKLSRKVLAARLGISYNAFCHRLNGFSNFSYEQDRQLCQILDQAAQAQKAEAENAPDPIYRG